MDLTALPDHVLAKIFQTLDVRSRVRCELVCRKFRDVATKIYASHPWKELPSKKVTMVISAWCRFSDVLWNIENVISENDTTRITILNRGKEDSGIKRRHEWFSVLLDSILTKFSTYVETFEIHNAELNSTSLKILMDYHDRIDSLKILGCRFEWCRATDVAGLMAVYSGKIVVEARCICSGRRRGGVA